jgi:hypothetical protein
MQYEEDQKHYLLAKMLACLVLPVLCLLFVAAVLLFIYLP